MDAHVKLVSNKGGSHGCFGHAYISSIVGRVKDLHVGETIITGASYGRSSTLFCYYL